MPDVKLLDCPMCGDNASAQRFGNRDGGAAHAVWCDSCHLSTPWMHGDDDAGRAIAAWNRRAAPDVGAVELPGESVDTPEFRAILAGYVSAHMGLYSRAEREQECAALIAHIKSYAARHAASPCIYVSQATLDLIAQSSFVKHEITVRTEPNPGWVALGRAASTDAVAGVEVGSGRADTRYGEGC